MTALVSYRVIIKLVGPLALGMVNNALMQFTDRAFLAHESLSSLEAVLPAALLVFVFAGFFQSVVAYGGVFVAQYYGASDWSGCVASYRAAQVLAWISGLFLVALLPIGPWAFSLMSPRPEVFAREVVYYDICLAGSFFLCAQMAVSAYFTGRGRTRLVWVVNFVGNGLNIVLDPLLIFGFETPWLALPALGIAGAAYATVSSMIVQWVILMMAAKCEHQRSKETWRKSFRERILPLMGRILRFGVPAGGFSVLNMLSFTLFVFASARVGDLAFAVSNACFTINYLLIAPMEGFGLGVQTLVGHVRGQGQDGQAGILLRKTLVLAVGIAACTSLAVLFCYRPLLTFFAPPEVVVEESFLELGFKLLVLMSIWMLFDATDIVVTGALKGAGDTRFVFWWMLFCVFVLWLPLVWLVLEYHCTMPAFWGTLVFYVIALSLGVVWRWRSGYWRSIILTRDAQKVKGAQ